MPRWDFLTFFSYHRQQIVMLERNSALAIKVVVRLREIKHCWKCQEFPCVPAILHAITLQAQLKLPIIRIRGYHSKRTYRKSSFSRSIAKRVVTAKDMVKYEG